MALFKRLSPVELDECNYEMFTTISRTLHLDDAQECIRNRRLIPQRVPREAFSCLSNTNMKVFWFGIQETEQNWYGNIRFQIELKKLMKDNNRLRMYYIDHVQFRTKTISRILITNKGKRQLPQDIIQVDLSYDAGHPLYRSRRGNYYHLVNHERLDNRNDRKGHELEILIDGDSDLSTYLFNNCDRVPVAHDNANSGQPNSCFKYANKGLSCPFAFSKRNTKSRIENMAPGFWRNAEILEDYSSMMSALEDFDY